MKQTIDHKLHWRSYHDKHSDCYARIWEEHNPLAKELPPLGPPEGFLMEVLEIAYADPGDPWIERFLDRTDKVLARVLEAGFERYHLWDESHPLRRQGVYQNLALCTALRGGDADRWWRLCAGDCLQCVRHEHPRKDGKLGIGSNVFSQCMFLTAVRMDLLRGDPKSALNRFALLKGPVRWVTVEAGLWRRVAEHAVAGEPIPPELASEVEGYFDEARDPHYDAPPGMNLVLARVEIGGVLFRYIRHPGEPIDWWLVVDAVAR